MRRRCETVFASTTRLRKISPLFPYTTLFRSNDIDGTVVEEKIYHEAGATTSQSMRRGELLRLIKLAGRTPVERSSRSEEHTSELQSQSNLVCRLLLEKKKKAPLVTRTVLDVI